MVKTALSLLSLQIQFHQFDSKDPSYVSFLVFGKDAKALSFAVKEIKTGFSRKSGGPKYESSEPEIVFSSPYGDDGDQDESDPDHDRCPLDRSYDYGSEQCFTNNLREDCY